MRRSWVGWAGAVLVGLGAQAFGGAREIGDVSAGQLGVEQSNAAAPAAVPSREELIQILQARLQEREREVAALKSSDEGLLYAEAASLGIDKAVQKSGLPARQQRRLAVAIVREAKKNGIDPLLVTAVIRCESSFNPYAVSNVGALGLMQVMPDTGAYLAELRGYKLGRAQNLFDPEINVELGAWYLSDLIKRFGGVDKALVAYNAGPGLAEKILKGKSRKKFMAGYPKTVLTEFNKLKVQQAKLEAARAVPVPSGEQARNET